MQEFILFEPSLIISKRRPISGTARRPRSGDTRSIAGQPVVLRSAPKNRPFHGYGAQALLGGVDRETAERYWAVAPKLKSTRPALD